MRDEDGLLTIIVSDRGPGVPEAERGKVLDRFYRTATVTGMPGSGLGLSLVNAIARHHGGQLILADNAPGLRVLLQLPKTDAHRASCRSRGRPQPGWPEVLHH